MGVLLGFIEPSGRGSIRDGCSPPSPIANIQETDHQIITEIDETNLHLVEIEVQEESNPQDIFKEK